MRVRVRHCYQTAVMAVLILAAGSVLAAPIIREILYDGPGSDADDVFTELSGVPGSNLDGWTLVGINGDTNVPIALKNKMVAVQGGIKSGEVRQRCGGGFEDECQQG